MNLFDVKLTKEEEIQLKNIYSPCEVAIPYADAWTNLCVTREGYIRAYGVYREKVMQSNETTCYLESKDLGLSWKNHLVLEENILGASIFVKDADFFFNAKIIDGKAYFNYAKSPDDKQTTVKISDNPYLEIGKFYYFDKPKRIIIVAHERRTNLHPTAVFAVLLISDDFGKSFKEVKLGTAPFFEKVYPHQGMRWQQNNRENTIVELSNGKLMMFTRTATDYHFVTYSSDYGDTWEEYQKTDFHSTATMPNLLKLKDGRILLFWCNTKPLPELKSADGVWEDYFTNRDASHVAITEDDGNTWFGFRELRLSQIRNNADYRSIGDLSTSLDKSVHQFEALELPYNKVLVFSGQNVVSRRIAIFDLDWLYEKSRKEDFISGGLVNWSTHCYVKSISGYYTGEGTKGHCQYNRVTGAYLLPSDDGSKREALYISYQNNDNLISKVSGATWNFPISKKGTISINMKVGQEGIRISLLDFWINPTDETVKDFSGCSFVINETTQEYKEYKIVYDTENNTCVLYLPNGESRNYNIVSPNGICYIHFQTNAREYVNKGTFIKEVEYTGKN